MKPSHAANDNLIDQTRHVWQPRLGRDLTARMPGRSPRTSPASSPSAALIAAPSSPAPRFFRRGLGRAICVRTVRSGPQLAALKEDDRARHCYRLAHASQNENAWDRALRRANNASYASLRIVPSRSRARRAIASSADMSAISSSVSQFWTESRNRWRCRFRAADPRPRRGSAGVSRYYGAFTRRAPGLA